MMIVNLGLLFSNKVIMVNLGLLSINPGTSQGDDNEFRSFIN